ncbi:response regulator transcription factor [Vibrio sp. 10N.261.46.E12]|uniref:response regulator transcription factor n=1 Tax=unclassified Vibrio TaxID=2614977 RepID=UPI0009768075|nr:MULTISPECIES: response regulator transcription factor [unclassified Vibrio]OMO35990.1 DNA-binding response regulator [Vibrio sp. 10N.261.45.E1]PMJ19932.1 DNA-binding response regulator [Vibrio sp. 10N.286.45.B6]PML85325.1 DNA-binding response regulator [Vibrio sp. 10N.261.49.E11]PMM72662.1 DNA-binding response regulator [Vibrio sp. 10N.261.46.F12]PMM84131.1 DNA-binding response regulator [Vibrio sp. 10N.261.46.E8]
MKILIIEDDTTTREFIAKGLEEHGYADDQAEDGKKGLMMALSSEYQLVVLDRMLPYLDGMKVLSAIKATEENLPVLILSAMDSVEDRVNGLQAGSDDYLIKPFALAELIARVDIIINRTKRQSSSDNGLAYDCLKIDLRAHRVMCMNQELQLQPKEFQLIQYFVEHSEQVVSRMRLFEAIWSYHFDPKTNVIDVHVANLRRKLDEAGCPDLLHTVRGAGYVLRR